MSRKGKRRREARRRARDRRDEQRPEGPPQEQTVAAEAEGREQDERLLREEEPVRSVSAVEARRARATRRRAKRKGGFCERVGRVRVSSWMITVPVLAIGTGVLAVLILTSGSSGTTGGGAGATPTPDPRVEGLPIDVSFDIEAGDDGSRSGGGSFFRPDAVTANAGDVVEFVVTNTGSVTHNIWLAGADNEYETADDFGPINLISPGDTGRLVSKIDEPDIYLFKCQIHPQLQFGTLTLE